MEVTWLRSQPAPDSRYDPGQTSPQGILWPKGYDPRAQTTAARSAEGDVWVTGKQGWKDLKGSWDRKGFWEN